MPWIVPEDKLDDQQRDFINNVDIKQKNLWIKGFPGSGKSVLLAHTYRRIMAKERNAKVLVVVYTHSLIKMFEAAFEEMGLRAQIVTFFQFKKNDECYDFILSDEVQDLTPSVLREMKQRAKHVIVAGDENQSIFERDPVYREETVKPYQINSLLESREFSLNIIHRLSKSIRDVVEKFLPNMNIFSGRLNSNNPSTEVRLCEAYNYKEEVKYILREAKKFNNIGKTVGILIPTQKSILAFIQEVIEQAGKSEWIVQTNKFGNTDYGSLNIYLNKCGIPLQYVGNGYGNFDENSRKINVMTYHSSKGLDFDTVFLPFLNNSLFIVPNETMSKTLFMVAMTRSRENLFLTYNGIRHSYIDKFAEICHIINIHDTFNTQQKNNGDSIFAGF